MDQDIQEQANSPYEVSRAPSVVWVVALAVMGFGAVSAQVVGLNHLVKFGALKQEWIAEQEQRESIRQEWRKILIDCQGRTAEAQKTLAAVLAELDMSQSKRQEALASLDRVRNELNLTRQTCDETIGIQMEAERKSSEARQVEAETRAKIVGLAREKAELTVAVSALAAADKRLQSALAGSAKSLESKLAEISAARDDLARIRASVTENERDLRSSREARAKVSQDITALRQGLSKLAQEEIRVSRLIASKSSLLKETELLQSDCERLQTQKYHMEATVSALKSDQKKLGGIAIEKASASRELASIKARMTQLTIQNNEVGKSLMAKRKEMETAASLLDDYATRRAKDSAGLTTVKMQRDSAQEQYDRLVREIAALSEKQEELVNLDKLISARREKLAVLRRDWNAAQKDAKLMREYLHNLTSEVSVRIREQKSVPADREEE